MTKLHNHNSTGAVYDALSCALAVGPKPAAGIDPFATVALHESGRLAMPLRVCAEPAEKD